MTMTMKKNVCIGSRYKKLREEGKRERTVDGSYIEVPPV